MLALRLSQEARIHSKSPPCDPFLNDGNHRWAKYETAVPGTFRLLPPKERVSELARDYSSMQEMFFRQPLAWSEVLDVLADLEKRINAASRD